MKIKTLFLIAMMPLAMVLSACAGDNGAPTRGTIYSKKDYAGYEAYPLLWDSKRQDGADWTLFVLNLIHNEVPELTEGASDIEQFCPRYYQLEMSERVNFWAFLISGIVKYESDFNPLKRMHETTMGTDPITKLPVYSEGLMQLSYQDVRPYPFCEFDWTLDRDLRTSDPERTILDPYKNLHCGIKILATQIRNRGRITLSSGVYWSVLKINGRYSKISQIATLTKTMPGCM